MTNVRYLKRGDILKFKEKSNWTLGSGQLLQGLKLNLSVSLSVWIFSDCLRSYRFCYHSKSDPQQFQRSIYTFLHLIPAPSTDRQILRRYFITDASLCISSIFYTKLGYFHIYTLWLRKTMVMHQIINQRSTQLTHLLVTAHQFNN